MTKNIEITVNYAADSKIIETNLGDFTVLADGGDRVEPSPGALFVAGLVACTASTARGYCHRHDLPFPEGMKVSASFNEETGFIESIDGEFLVPPDFPQENLDALIRAAGACTVKKWWQNPPEFNTSAIVREEIAV
jgi:ribosomal protein S12 methylthiotransferase accessory factor